MIIARLIPIVIPAVVVGFKLDWAWGIGCFFALYTLMPFRVNR